MLFLSYFVSLHARLYVEREKADLLALVSDV